MASNNNEPLCAGNERIIQTGPDSKPTDIDNRTVYDSCNCEDDANKFMDNYEMLTREEKELLVIKACEFNWPDIVDRLAESDVNVNFIHDYSKTPLMIATENGHVGVMEKLLKSNADVHIEILMRKTALHIACESGNLESVKLLVRYGSNINAKAVFGVPVVYAIRKDCCEIVKYFLESGYDVNGKDDQGNTLLHNCGFCDSHNTARLLLKFGADIEETNNQKQTPLSYLIVKDSKRTVEILLGQGADVNSKCQLLNTPLHYASQYNRIDIVKLLLTRKVDATCKNRQEQTALDIAINNNNEEIVTLLEKHC